LKLSRIFSEVNLAKFYIHSIFLQKGAGYRNKQAVYPQYPQDVVGRIDLFHQGSAVPAEEMPIKTIEYTAKTETRQNNNCND
jgi:hypothetical protein